MSSLIDNLIDNVKKGKYNKIYNIFLVIIIATLVIRTFTILSSPKPYLLVKSENPNNIFEEEENSVESSAQIVKFDDENFEYKIRSILGINDRDVLDSDMKKLVSIDLNHDDIISLEGLQYCTNLKKINLSHNHVESIEQLKSLSKLEEINLYNNEVTDISALSNLVNLKKIDLAENNIKDVTPMKSLENLQELDLYDNEIQSIGALGNLKNLTFLDVSKNRIEDLAPLKELNIASNKLLYWGNNN